MPVASRLAIPPRFVAEFVKQIRVKGPGTAGTKPVDRALMKRVVTQTLSNRAFLQDLANYALTRSELRLR
jgi:hypothetical protein